MGKLATVSRDPTGLLYSLSFPEAGPARVAFTGNLFMLPVRTKSPEGRRLARTSRERFKSAMMGRVRIILQESMIS